MIHISEMKKKFNEGYWIKLSHTKPQILGYWMKGIEKRDSIETSTTTTNSLAMLVACDFLEEIKTGYKKNKKYIETVEVEEETKYHEQMPLFDQIFYNGITVESFISLEKALDISREELNTYVMRIKQTVNKRLPILYLIVDLFTQAKKDDKMLAVMLRLMVR